MPLLLLLESEEDSETIEWWELKQESEANHSDMPQVCLGDDILLTPDTCAHSRAASDDSADSEDSGSEDSGTSDENSDDYSDEDETDSETAVQCANTTADPFRALNEISQYCSTLRLEMIQQEPISDSGIPATHKQAHLSADQKPKRPKVHQCDHEGCNYSSYQLGNLKRHQQTHLPADQRPKRPKLHQCDHEGCDFSFVRAYDLKRHKLTHLPADQRPRRVKRKACDQLPSNEKRKKVDKE